MSVLRRRIFLHTITTRALVVIIFSLIVVGSVCTLLTIPRALAATIVSDDFDDNSLDTAKWDTNLFSGFTTISFTPPAYDGGHRSGGYGYMVNQYANGSDSTQWLLRPASNLAATPTLLVSPT